MHVLVQADSGAQAVQIFDSWASHLAPQDFDVFAGPYIKRIIDDVKSTHPDLPIILYISGSGVRSPRLCGPASCMLRGCKLGSMCGRRYSQAARTCCSMKALILWRQVACWSAWRHAAQTSCQSTAAWI